MMKTKKFKEPKKGDFIRMNDGQLGIIKRIGVDVITIHNGAMDIDYEFSDFDKVMA